jgi:putative DNA primase/helicase
MSHDNYHDVVRQMEDFGVILMQKDLPLQIDRPKRKTCGKGGKWWYWLQTFKPDAGGSFIVGRYGSYKTGASEKVIVDWKPLSEAERDRRKREHELARQRQEEARKREADEAAMSAADLWRAASPVGSSPYLARKLVEGESCRFLPDSSILIPLLRYDRPRRQALVGLQRIYPGPRKHWKTGEELTTKTFTAGFAKTGASLRLGAVSEGEPILFAEGYSTALSIRMATRREVPVFMTLDAGNLPPVVQLVRELYPEHRFLICADDDWKTRDHTGELWNAGRVKAKEAAKSVDRCDVVYPSFYGLARGDKHTDFNDLHVLGGLPRVTAQLQATLNAIRRHRLTA